MAEAGNRPCAPKTTLVRVRVRVSARARARVRARARARLGVRAEP